MTGSSPLFNPSLLPVLLAALSHEFGSSLAAIKGAATTLLDYRQCLPDERIASFLQMIDTQTDDLTSLLDDLVLFARLQASTLHLQLEPVSLRDVVEQAIDQLAPDKRGDFLIEGDQPVIRADVPYLRRTFVLLFQYFTSQATTRNLI